MSTVEDVRRGVVNSEYTPYLILGLLALALRSIQIGVLPLTDQQITIKFVRRFGMVELITEIPRVQPHFPLYYVLLDVWSVVFPIRQAYLVSVAAGVLTPLVLYRWVNPHLPHWRAVLAALLLSLSPLLIIQSRWLRMYSLLTLFALLSWYAAWRYYHGGSVGVYGLTAVVTIGLHPFGIACVLSQLLWLSIEQYRTEFKPYFRGLILSVVTSGGLGGLWLAFKLADIRGTGPVDPEHMHIQYAVNPVVRAVVLPITTLVGTLHTRAEILFAVGLTGLYAYWLLQSRVWTTKLGRVGLCWVGVSLCILYVGQAIRPILMLKYLGWLAPGVALLVAQSTPNNVWGNVGLGGIGGLVSLNLLFGWLIKINNSMVAIWGYGVLEGV